MSLTVTSASFDSKKASYCLYNKASRTDLYFVDHGNGTVDSYETVYITTAFNGSKPAVLGPGQKEEIERAIASYNAGILDMLSKMASGELRVKYDTDTYRKVELASRCEQPSCESHLICRDQDNASLTVSVYCAVVYPLYVDYRNKRVEVRTLKASIWKIGLASGMIGALLGNATPEVIKWITHFLR